MKNPRKRIIASLEFLVWLYGCESAADLCQQFVQTDLADQWLVRSFFAFFNGFFNHFIHIKSPRVYCTGSWRKSQTTVVISYIIRLY